MTARAAPAPKHGPSRLLTRDEEVELARQFRLTRDPALSRILVESHLRLVSKVARQCCSRKSMLADVVQEGCLGLMRAVEKYDPDRGIRLSSYAVWWIRAFIFQYIMANSRMMRVATTYAQRKLFFNLHREVQRLEGQGKEVDSKEIGVRLGVAEKVVVEMRARLGGREVEFDATVGVDASSSRGPDGMSASPRPDEEVADRQLRAAVRRRLDEVAEDLEPRERAILRERLLADDPITLGAIGIRFGISRERARQVEAQMIRRLRPIFQDLLGTEIDDSPPRPLAA